MSISGVKINPWVVLCIAVAVVCLVATTSSFYHVPSARDFRAHRARYEQVIAKVKTLPWKNEVGSTFWMASNLDPATLSSKRVNNTTMEGMVEARRDAETGKIWVIITVEDKGHVGTFGYTYREDPASAASMTQEWQSTQQLDAHWRLAENRSW